MLALRESLCGYPELEDEEKKATKVWSEKWEENLHKEAAGLGSEGEGRGWSNSVEHFGEVEENERLVKGEHLCILPEAVLVEYWGFSIFLL